MTPDQAQERETVEGGMTEYWRRFAKLTVAYAASFVAAGTFLWLLVSLGLSGRLDIVGGILLFVFGSFMAFAHIEMDRIARARAELNLSMFIPKPPQGEGE